MFIVIRGDNMKTMKIGILLIFPLLLLGSCNNSASVEEDNIFPVYVDADENGVNDYVESPAHVADAAPVSPGSSSDYPKGRAGQGHGFVDTDGDGICDYAQNGSNTWHGPGFVDGNGNGVCDYWDEDHPMHGSHDGMRYRDQNHNRVNDYMEPQFHMGGNHQFLDENGDGICDYAQDGSPSWHGPNFVDNNNDGVCDYWQRGGRGHGGRHGDGHRGGGPW